MKRTGVIIVAGGSGQRMGADVPKQFLPLNGVPVLAVTLRRLLAILPGSPFVVVLPKAETGRWEEICRQQRLTGTHLVCVGGATRFESVCNGLAVLEECEYVAIHDGVRPVICKAMVRSCIETAEKNGTAVPVVKPVDSFRIMEGGHSRIINRDALRAVQTPQVFRRDIIEAAYSVPFDERFTDDASVVEFGGVNVSLCEGDRRNIKITTKEDMALASLFVKESEWN